MSHVERECLAILTHLAKNGYTDIHTIARETNVSFANVQRYLRRECWEIAPALKATDTPGTFRDRQMAWFLRQRRLNPKMYHRYVQTLKPDGDKFRINRSKHDILLHFAHVHHFDVIRTREYPGFSIHNNPSYNGSLPSHSWDEPPGDDAISSMPRYHRRESKRSNNVICSTR